MFHLNVKLEPNTWTDRPLHNSTQWYFSRLLGEKRRIVVPKELYTQYIDQPPSNSTKQCFQPLLGQNELGFYVYPKEPMKLSVISRHQFENCRTWHITDPCCTNPGLLSLLILTLSSHIAFKSEIACRHSRSALINTLISFTSCDLDMALPISSSLCTKTYEMLGRTCWSSFRQ